MIRRIFYLAVMLAIFPGCGNNGNKDVAVKTDVQEPALQVKFAALVENPGDYIGKNIIVEGKVVHVCTETGKKMFIVGDNPDVRLFVAAGENIPKFPMELLGSEISVEGTIVSVAGAAMGEDKMQMKGKEGMEGMSGHIEGEGKMGGDSCETETALSQQPSLANIIMEYRSHTVK